MIKPGTIQMSHGKWLIGTQLKGFRPQKVVLDYKVCRQFLWKIQIGCGDPLLNSRIGYWIECLKDIQTDNDVQEIIRQIKYYTGKTPETIIQKRLAEICGWLNYLSMKITSCPEPQPFNTQTVSQRIKKESVIAPNPLLSSRMIHWSEQVENLNFTYVKTDMERYCKYPSNSFERNLKAMAKWMDKLQEETNGNNH